MMFAARMSCRLRLYRRLLLFSLPIGLTLFSLSCDLLGRAGVRTYLAEPFPSQLSSWRLFKVDGGKLRPNQGVVPYELNTPLFSDYADKSRHVWMPANTAATYNRDEVFDFPVGTIISKTFAFPDEHDASKQRLVETRILVRGKERWFALPYVWNQPQTEARLELVASPVDITFKDPGGTSHKISYSIPNANECAQCHERNKVLQPIGPKARNLNRDLAYADGTTNQIAYWTMIGYLKGAPSPDQTPKAAIWNDPSSGSLEARARAYLDNNCAHCHRAGGVAGYTGMLLDHNETDLRRLGFFKPPNSAGYTGGRPFDIVPGDPAASILLYRMESTRPKEMMPEIGRAIPHQEGIALVREWLSSLAEEKPGK
jgi:uncharacterized repeat protein (TIGR03806 family)